MSDNMCISCRYRERAEREMMRFGMEILMYLKDHRIVKLDSCILCVKKHVSRAMIYYEELLTAENSGKADGSAAVNVPMNHLKILGHLGCAIEESEDFTELHTLLLKTERDYRYNGISPDWKAIAEQISITEKAL